MRPVDRYVENVMRNLFTTAAERERLEADLRAHFAEAEARGESPAEIIDAMGEPAEVAAVFNAERQIRYAGFWQRLVAFLGDCGVLLVIVLPLIGLFLFAEVSLAEAEPAVGRMIAVILLGLSACGIGIFYFPLLEAHFGKTLGKHLLRIRVVRESGAPIGLGQAFVRRLSFYFEMLWVDALFVPFTEKRQRALDIVAKTIVAREPGEEAPWWGYAVCLLLPVAALVCLGGLAILCGGE